MRTQPIVIKGKIKLRAFDPAYSGGLDKVETKERVQRLGEEIGQFQQLLYANSRHAVCSLPGARCERKRRRGPYRTPHVNPARREMANFKVPSEKSARTTIFGGFTSAMPRYRQYRRVQPFSLESVLVERVLGIVPKAVWLKRYVQIVEFRTYARGEQCRHPQIPPSHQQEEQAERFRERLAEPRKELEIFPRGFAHPPALLDDYMRRVRRDAERHQSSSAAPWHIVPADRNGTGITSVADTVVRAMKGLKLQWPKPKEDLSKIRFK